MQRREAEKHPFVAILLLNTMMARPIVLYINKIGYQIYFSPELYT